MAALAKLAALMGCLLALSACVSGNSAQVNAPIDISACGYDQAEQRVQAVRLEREDARRRGRRVRLRLDEQMRVAERGLENARACEHRLLAYWQAQGQRREAVAAEENVRVARSGVFWSIIELLAIGLSFTATAVAAWAAVVAARAAVQQASVAMDALEEGQRPHFLISVAPRRFAAGVQMTAPDSYAVVDYEEHGVRVRASRITEFLEITVAGARPALGLSLKVAIGLRKDGKQLRPEDVERSKKLNALRGFRQFVAGDPQRSDVRVPVFYRKYTLGEIDQKLRAGTHTLYLAGMLVYQDMNIVRERGFCFEPIVEARDPLGFFDIELIGGYFWKVSEDLSLNFDRKREEV